jgi:uroporphyrinogen-III decarboxylase
MKMPETKFPDSAWDKAKAAFDAMDTDQVFSCTFYPTGLFEELHFLMGMEDAMSNFYEEPEAMHGLLDFLTDYELRFAEETCKHLHPQAIFHHDDWGSYRSTFISKDMFDEFFVPRYKKIYQCWRAGGAQLVVHHNDAYSATLVPSMIDMGIDVWQGPSETNDVPSLVKKYCGKISFMGDLDSGKLDKKDWSKDELKAAALRACKNNGKHYFIPCLTQGGHMDTFHGVYDAMDEAIDEVSKELF